MTRSAPTLLDRLTVLLPEGLGQRLILRKYRQLDREHDDAWRDPGLTRQRTLAEILAAHARSELGRELRFDDTDTAAAFRERVPLGPPAAHAAALTRQLEAEAEGLIAGPLLALLDGGEGDRFPVGTDALTAWQRREERLERALLARLPRCAGGLWLELLPPHEPGEPLAPLPPAVARARLGLGGGVLPAWLFTLQDDRLRSELLLRLSLEQPIRVLRAPSAGALVLLARTLAEATPRLLESLATGRALAGRELPEEITRRLPRLRARRAKAERLAERARLRGALEPRDLWPSLRALICPSGGAARATLRRLREHYGALPLLDPGIELAAGAVSEPFWADARWGSPPALRDALLELRDDEDAIVDEHGLRWERGARYEIVLTSHRGCYRRALERRVEVVGVEGAMPLLAPAPRRAGELALRLDAPTAVVHERQLREAMLTAARELGIGVVGFDAALLDGEHVAPLPPLAGAEVGERARDEPAAAAASDGRAPGLFGRLWQRARRAVEGPEAPAASERRAASASAAPRAFVGWSLEPARELDAADAAALATRVELELSQRAPAYSAERLAGRLDRARGFILNRGTLARRARARVWRGDDPPATCARGLTASLDEVALHVEAAE